jgi:hypothetical protein
MQQMKREKLIVSQNAKKLKEYSALGGLQSLSPFLQEAMAGHYHEQDEFN